MRRIFLFTALLFVLRCSAQKLSAEEKKVVDLVNSQMPQTLQLLEQLVNINSGTLNTAGVKSLKYFKISSMFFLLA